MYYRDWLPDIAAGLVLAVAITITLIIGLATLGNQTPDQTETQAVRAQEQRTDRAAEQPQPRIPIALPNLIGAEKRSRGGDEYAYPSSNGSLFWGDGVAQWVMAVTSIAALMISAWAVWLVNKQLVLTRNALLQTQKATKATEASVAVTEDTARRQLRAYIDLVDAKFMRENQKCTWMANIFLKNCGLTPAYNVSAWIKADIEDPIGSGSLDFSGGDMQSRGCIGPGGIFNVTLRFRNPTLSDADISRIVSHRAALYVFGEITYEDTFGRPQITRYRLMLEDENTSVDDFRLVVCAEGNEAS